jgi:hypothetical protein
MSHTPSIHPRIGSSPTQGAKSLTAMWGFFMPVSWKPLISLKIRDDKMYIWEIRSTYYSKSINI